MDSSGLRREWTSFFAARGHTIVPSAGLIPHHPSAPMFTNSGMMPFVPYFLGEEPAPFDPPRAASVQRCVRAGGKHNDLDAIGRSARHLSFFEMLGNFSFGDYFKRDAIVWAWELLTGPLGLDADRLWVTVHVSDDEAEQLWIDEVGLPAARIQRLDKDNFWEMGDVGPCGPSSEIFWDFGAAFGPDGGPANPAAEQRFVEIWNLVFTQFFRQPDGSLSDLAKKNIDTGAGLERLLTAINGVVSVFDTGDLAKLVEAAQSLTGRSLGSGDERTDVALRLLADHTRTMAFLVADGVIPSNTERGYVLRRIIRRAIRFAYLLGTEGEVTGPLLSRCVGLMGDAYPELAAAADRVGDVLGREESQFRRTLARGSSLLDERLAGLERGDTLAGEVAFDLYETYGFPLEVTEEITAERGIEVERAGYDAALARAKAVSGSKASKASLYENLTDFQSVLDRFGPTEFVGRDTESSPATVVAVLEGTEGELSIFLDRTPFYAESGGQVGDTGTITTATGTVEVLDTVLALPGLFRHVARLVEGHIESGQEATATIDGIRRAAIRRNHTATHLLHWALRTVLGDHVKQQGSLVAPERLRFDFSHYEPVTDAQIRELEDLVNADVLANSEVRHFETTKAEAEALGAIAFFGDKYGDMVRVLEAGPHSTELCGGTHVHATGDIGPLKVVSEGSIGSNLRRIEAVTGTGPIDRLRDTEQVLEELAGVLNVPVGEVVEGARKRVEELKALRHELRSAKTAGARARATDLLATAVDGVVVSRVDGLDRDALRDLAVAMRDASGIRGVVLGAAPEGGGAALVAAVTAESGLHAGELVSAGAKAIKGGGGKDPLLAVAGGKDPSGLDEALALARAAAGLS